MSFLLLAAQQDVSALRALTFGVFVSLCALLLACLQLSLNRSATKCM